MIYVDSNIFIYPVLYDPKSFRKSALAKEKLLEITSKKLDACTCSLTWDEVTWITRKFFGESRSIVQGASLLKLPNLKFLSVDLEVVSVAQGLMEKYGLKPRDSIHAATALKNGVKEILSDDTHFDEVREIMRVPL